MTFLAPLAGIIAGAITVPTLVAFYLLKLRRRPVRISSTLFWDAAVRDAQGNIPWRLVRPHAQFFLQLLALLLLLLAFARPAIPGTIGSRLMIVLDASASMGSSDAEDDGEPRTRFDAARDRIRDRLGELLAGGSARQVMLVSLAQEATPLTPWTANRGVLRAALDAAEPTDQPASMDALAELIEAATGGDQLPLDAEETEAGPRRLDVLLVTDGDLPTTSDPLPANIVVQRERVPLGDAFAGVGNAAIVAASARRDYDDPASLRVFARVQAVGGAMRPTLVRAALDGEVVAERSVDLSPPAEGDARDATATVNLTIDAPSEGVLSLLLPGGDLLPADDAASLWLRTAGRPRVVLVIPDGGIIDPQRPGPAWLIAAVLEEMDLGALRVVRASTWAQLAAGRETPPFDVVVFDRVAPDRPPRIPSMHFGPPPPVPGLAIGAATPGALPLTRVVSWRRTHPLMRDLALDQLVVAEPLMIENEPDGDSEPGPSAGVTTLATGERGPLIVLVEDRGLRRIWVGFELAQSSWPRLVSFPLFLAEAVDFLALRGMRDAAVAFRTSEAASIRLSSPRDRVEFAGGGSGDTRLVRQFRSPVSTPRLGAIPRAGVYTLVDPVPGDQRALAVNLLDPRESALAAGVAFESEDAASGIGPQAGDGGERDVWHWFVLAALAILAIEWFLSARALSS
ncbi:MAG: VWA domain-containing protein [Planctomycetota bacterium]